MVSPPAKCRAVIALSTGSSVVSTALPIMIASVKSSSLLA